jgi:hypothetical protein
MNQRINDPLMVSDRKLAKIRSDFERGMQNAQRLFGAHAFRKWPEDTDDLYPLNRALFDAWSVLLSEVRPQSLDQNARTIVKEARRLMTHDDEFISAISTGTSSPQKVALRFDRLKKLLQRNVE